MQRRQQRRAAIVEPHDRRPHRTERGDLYGLSSSFDEAVDDTIDDLERVGSCQRDKTEAKRGRAKIIASRCSILPRHARAAGPSLSTKFDYVGHADRLGDST
jgi:hypothetical protein